MKQNLLICFLLLSFATRSQQCIPTNINGTVIDYVCPQTCSNLIFRIPHIKGTGDYTVSTIPFAPYPFMAGNGVELSALYADDVFSSVISLPFTFCFFGT